MASKKTFQDQDYFDKLALDYLETNDKIRFANSEAEKIKLEASLKEILISLKSLIYMRCSRYKKFSNFDDLVQDGYEALLMAFKTYRPGKSAFTWWSNKYIATKIARSASKHNLIKIPIAKAKNMKMVRADTISSSVDENQSEILLENSILIKKISNILNKMPLEDQEIFKYVYENNKNKTDQVINNTNFTKKELTRRYRKILKNIKSNILSNDE